ncbi:MAG: heme-binding domain-containing protein, partial [Verrucomicrobiota bacterium]
TENFVQPQQSREDHKGWHFPSGSAFAQTLVFGGKRAETRVTHVTSGEWHFLSYRWNEAQTDAHLVPEQGGEVLVPHPQLPQRTVTRRIPSRAECATCHTQASFFVLGVSTAQLDRGNQLEMILSTYPSRFRPHLFKPERRPAPLINPYHSHSGSSLDQRARTYLSINCAHCHREAGLGGRADLRLLLTEPLETAGLLNATPLVGLTGHPEAMVINPGHPETSELLHRMSLRDGGAQMPLLDTNFVDEEGVALLTEWILSLESQP